jgi:predicted metal-binding membrane protein
MVIAAQLRDWNWSRRAAGRGGEAAFAGATALLFAASAALTAVWCTSMPAAEMQMPGGWTMSMAWMRMPGQTLAGAAASFLCMWVVMMVAMMLPSVAPVLWRYREANSGPLSAVMGAAYFLVWTAIGAVVYPLGAALAAVEMEQPALSRAIPVSAGVVFLIAGALQFTAWKSHHLACCREAPRHGGAVPADVGAAWRHGLRLGLHCSYGCAGLTAILLVSGVMDLRAMAVITAAITAERLAPAADRVARGIGVITVIAGLWLIAQAAGLYQAL